MEAVYKRVVRSDVFLSWQRNDDDTTHTHIHTQTYRSCRAPVFAAFICYLLFSAKGNCSHASALVLYIKIYKKEDAARG